MFCKTARETVPFYIVAATIGGFFIIKLGGVILFSKQIFHAVSLSGGKDSTANMVRGLVLLYSLLGVFGLFLGDVLMTIFDPRIRLTGKSGDTR